MNEKLNGCWERLMAIFLRFGAFTALIPTSTALVDTAIDHARIH